MSNARNIAGITTDAVNASSELVPVYACRAMVLFDGEYSDASSSNALDTLNENAYVFKSENVSSVTWQSTGLYRITFSTNMPDENYVISLSSDFMNKRTNDAGLARTSSYFEVRTLTAANVDANANMVDIVVFY